MPASIQTQWPKDGSPLQAWACTDPDQHEAGGCKDFGPFNYPRRPMYVFETLTPQGHGVDPVLDDAGRQLQRVAESRLSIERHATNQLRQMCRQYALDEIARQAKDADELAEMQQAEIERQQKESDAQEAAEAQAALVAAIAEALNLKEAPSARP